MEREETVMEEKQIDPVPEEKQLDPVPEEIPSPEELFHTETKDEYAALPEKKRKPVPHYRAVKRFSAGFLIILVLVAAALLNLDKVGITYYYMESSSMEHVIPKGSFLFVYKTKAEKLEPKDIITFYNNDDISVTHVIVEVVPDYDEYGPGFRTKGTENVEWDEDTVSYSDVCGKVVFHIPYVGKWLSAWRNR